MPRPRCWPTPRRPPSTPHTPLLAGTRRAHLLRQGRLTEAAVTPADILSYTHVALFNAVIDLGELVLPTARVLPLGAEG